jgi:transposase
MLASPAGTQGAGSNYTVLPVEPVDRALGRSRGGLSTKIHALTDDHTRPITVILTGGQAGDNPQLVPLLELHHRQSMPGRSRRFRLLADKAYSHPSTRQQLRHKRIAHTIPERQDQKDRRKAKGAKGGRPPGFDQATYAKRNTVERGFLRLKQWRGIATRFDKHALTYLGGVILAATVIHFRTN